LKLTLIILDKPVQGDTNGLGYSGLFHKMVNSQLD
jgi:hypothetical protein